jgi:hypothetical protein
MGQRPKIVDIDSWQDMKDFCNSLTPKQLAQPVETIPANDNTGPQPIPLQPVIGAGTLKGLGCEPCRSNYDNEDHRDQVVLLLDCNRNAEDGHIAQDLMTGRKIYPDKRPWPPMRLT